MMGYQQAQIGYQQAQVLSSPGSTAARIVSVTVPMGFGSGSLLTIADPVTGSPLQVTVPAGYGQGDTFTVQLPPATNMLPPQQVVLMQPQNYYGKPKKDNSGMGGMCLGCCAALTCCALLEV